MSLEDTPTLASFADAAIEAYLRGVHTGMPGRVERYDAATQTADVKPLVKRGRKGEDGARIVISQPVITSVPVVWPGGGDFDLTFPLEEGDEVWLAFASCSLDRWGARGGEVDPEDERRFALTDAIAIPGLHAPVRPRANAPTDRIRLGGAAVALEVTASEVKVGGGVAPHEPTLKATTYRAAEDTYLSLIATALGLLGADPTLVAQAATKSALVACGPLTGFAAFQTGAAAAPTTVAKVR